MAKVSIIRPGAKHSVLMDTRAARTLVNARKFEYADPSQTALSRAKSGPAKRDATRSASPIINKTTGIEAEAQALEGKTKEQIVNLLLSYGEKVDRRQDKATLLKQAQRYQRRDMRAE